MDRSAVRGRIAYDATPNGVEKMSRAGLIWGFLRTRKKWWLTPIVVFMVLLSLLIVLSEGSAVAPFIYALF